MSEMLPNKTTNTEPTINKVEESHCKMFNI